MTILNTKKLPITLRNIKKQCIVLCYKLIRSATLVKSIGSAKPRKARVINFKARAKPKARALEKDGLFSITNSQWLYHFDLCRCHLHGEFFFRRRKKYFADEKLNFAGEKLILCSKKVFSPAKFNFSSAKFFFAGKKKIR